MKGPTPKDPAVRRRANKASTAATLELAENAEREAPELPSALFPGGQPLDRTRDWWEIIWRSPMASRWLESDIEGLYLIAVLRNEFFTRPTPTVAGEIRQQETRFGLSPIDRRRLDWRITGPQSEVPVPEEQEQPEERDTRVVLRAVK